MIQLSDNPSNTEFFYIYIKDFKWESPLENEDKGGHPIKGRVYRALKNTETGGYRIHVDTKSVPILLVFETLSSVENSHTADIVRLNKENFLDFDITDSDLTSLARWVKMDHSDIKTLMFDKPKALPPPIAFIKTNDEVESFIRCAHALHDLNPGLLNSLHDYMDFAIAQERSEDEDGLSTMYLSMSKEHGTGVNISQALIKLSKYTSSNRRISMDEKDLFGAITNLLNENTNQNL